MHILAIIAIATTVNSHPVLIGVSDPNGNIIHTEVIEAPYTVPENLDPYVETQETPEAKTEVPACNLSDETHTSATRETRFKKLKSLAWRGIRAGVRYALLGLLLRVTR